MEQRSIVITPDSVIALVGILEDSEHQDDEYFVRLFRVHCEEHDWSWFGLEPKAEFNQRAFVFTRAVYHARSCAERRDQLLDDNWSYWIFHSDPDCMATHQELDKIALPPDHPFWTFYSVPLGWHCGCSIIGANSERSVLRLDGDPTKPLPNWWNTPDPDTGLRPGIDALWEGVEMPRVLDMLAAIADGAVPPQPS